MPEQHSSDDRPARLRPQQILFALALLALISLSAVSLWQQTRPQPLEILVIPPPPSVTPQPTATPGPLTVYVTGAVHAPGVHMLAPGSRVQDALAAADGALAGADLTLVNLAAPLRDGMQVHVAQRAQATPRLATDSARMRINHADEATLQQLPGIGPVLAQRIIRHREEFGPFADLAALDAVSGIGPVLLRNLEALLRFD